MKIKENSWHWSLYSMFNEESYSDWQRNQKHGWDTLSFCKYARNVALILLFLIAVGSVALFWAGSIVTFIVYALINGLGFLQHKVSAGFWEAIANIGFVLSLITLAGLLIFGVVVLVTLIKESIKEKARSKRYQRIISGEPEPEPSFFYSWYKSVKDKICPTLEFIEEEVVDEENVDPR
jgi:D-alanyl-lipoteichoic acid acyltransferase DltB (MBOAT superfamily)